MLIAIKFHVTLQNCSLAMYSVVQVLHQEGNQFQTASEVVYTVSTSPVLQILVT